MRVNQKNIVRLKTAESDARRLKSGLNLWLIQIPLRLCVADVVGRGVELIL